jgi:hypothetical protein
MIYDVYGGNSMSTVFFSVGMTLDGFITGITPIRPAHASIPGDGGQPD